MALRGRRVLELADEKGVYCGKLLADMGADVIKIERPGGDATRQIPPFVGNESDPDGSLFFLYTNTGKRGVTLDLARPEGRARFRELARTADLVVETLPPGSLDELDLGYASLRELNPALVLTSITGFGQTGPQRDFKSSDLVASALGSSMRVTGEAEDPPVRLAGSQAFVAASVTAAASSMIALYHSTASGRGQHVDISVEEVAVSVSHICGVGKWLDDGVIPTRCGTGLVAAVPSGSYACRDGRVYLMVNRPLHWRALARWIHEVTGNVEVLDPMFEGPSSNRLPHRELLDLFIGDLVSQFSAADFYHEAQRRHLAVTPVNGAAEVAGDAHLAARDYFVDVEHPKLGPLRQPGALYRLSETPWRTTRPAPGVGQHNAEVFGSEFDVSAEARAPSARREPSDGVAGARALEGLKVVEFSAAMAGPWVGRFLAYCGAETIRVESKKHPDVVRLYVPPRAPELGTQPQLSPWFTDWNAGKRFVALDLTQPRALELAKRLVARCDVVIENYSSGVMDKLGLGYSELVRVNPRLVMLSTSGYGDRGPYHRYVTWGSNIEALAGLSKLSGFPWREGAITQYAYPDALSALHGLFAVMCALDHRSRSGRGQHISLAQFETTVGALGHVLMEHLVNGRDPQRQGNRSTHAAPHGCYRCAGEDRWCAIAVSSDAEWESFREVLGDPAWARAAKFNTLGARLANADALDEKVEEWTRERSDYEVMAVLQHAGVAAGVVQNVEDLLRNDPQLRARGFFEEIEHLKRGRVVATGVPLGLTGTPGRSGVAGAALGQDNEHVFGTLLGMTPQEIRECMDSGAIEGPDCETSVGREG
ncbi:MAG: CoA transferase [Deltaproteobacteria bacterium]|nr:CoA transferase [Deltaproteobacteria bacterium]MBW2359619.1 CoA transferase [Deltaproteobacteria bacterium]